MSAFGSRREREDSAMTANTREAIAPSDVVGSLPRLAHLRGMRQAAHVVRHRSQFRMPAAKESSLAWRHGWQKFLLGERLAEYTQNV
jgi:hypothetical protein